MDLFCGRWREVSVLRDGEAYRCDGNTGSLRERSAEAALSSRDSVSHRYWTSCSKPWRPQLLPDILQFREELSSLITLLFSLNLMCCLSLILQRVLISAFLKLKIICLGEFAFELKPDIKLGWIISELATFPVINHKWECWCPQLKWTEIKVY